MTLYKPSTEKEPLLFFSSFLNEHILNQYENNFYGYPINPSQIFDNDQGFIEYHKDCYEGGEKPTVKIYFKEYLWKQLKTQSVISENFLIERKKEQEYNDVFSNRFVQKQLVLLESIMERAKNLSHADTTVEILDDLKLKITSLLNHEGELKPKRIIKKSLKITNPFFGNTERTTVRRLKKLYAEVLDIGLIDEEEVTEEVFVDVFTSAKPFDLEEQIKFNRGNYEAIYFIQELSAYFDKLEPAQIGKSKAFASKGDRTITDKTVNTYFTRLKKKDKNSYKDIKQAILNALSSKQ